MTKLIVITGFIVAFSAGLMVGHVWTPPKPAQSGDRPHSNNSNNGNQGSWIASQLSLSRDQQKQMEQIWSNVGGRGRENSRERRSQMRREQDEAIAKLIRPEDRQAYDAVIAEQKQKFEAIEAEGKRAFQQAVEKTKAILSAEQLRKYEELLARPGSGSEGRDRDRSESRPSEKRDR
ncbi:MAG: hypothetical protein H7144_12965 [Burkholderiales bacterium]|nr:hypothetical protein [Phycisphaerae bacterium]